ncbi:hypothetical protein Rt10032_c02g0874 [Rhodotorula toruloides]|uniref:Zn(2)-C6 fungal-type domain-containing protein n=1 Tax=Rhodotorula toruloides TaxID=5286 RepID=A0A511K927_RHOTO|nr:hypothetical protein Rt10032_c02g0874 [Rhodotorula toruloides]
MARARSFNSSEHSDEASTAASSLAKSSSPLASTSAESGAGLARDALAERSCEMCRRRRVRCSREIPTCSNCVKRGEKCSLGEPRQESEVELAPPAKKAKRKGDGVAKKTQTTTSVKEKENLPPRRISPPSPVSRSHSIQMPPPTQREETPEQEEAPPVAAEPASRPPRQLFPSFPVGAASYRTKVAADTREALTRTVTHGVDAPFDKIALQGLRTCDHAYQAPGGPDPPTLFPFALANQDVPQPSEQQAHNCISTYMIRVEPALQLFAPSQARQAFLIGGMGMWMTGEVPNQRGWLACYLAALAHGAMSMTKEEWHLSGRSDAREATARQWLLEAGRALAVECFTRKPTMAGLRACLLILQYHLLGFGGPPDVPTIIAFLPVIVRAACELGLHQEQETGPLADEKRALWAKIYEHDVTWAPLLGTRLSFCPSEISTRLPDGSSGQQRNAASSTFCATLAFSVKLTHLLNLPHPPASFDLLVLSNELNTIRKIFEPEDAPSEPLTELLVDLQTFRLQAALDEAGATSSEATEEAWRNAACELLNTNPTDCPQPQHLLMIVAFFHSLILVVLRWRTDKVFHPSFADSLVSDVLTKLAELESATWPIPLHQTLQRGILTVRALVQLPPTANPHEVEG